MAEGEGPVPYGGIHNEGRRRMGAKEKEKSGKIKCQRNRQIHSTGQSREPAERATFWLNGGKEAGPVL